MTNHILYIFQNSEESIVIQNSGSSSDILTVLSAGPRGPQGLKGDPGDAGGGGAVSSVNGKTGEVTLAALDVGAAPTVHSHAITDVMGLQDALDSKQAASTVLTNTTASFTTAEESKLAGIEPGAQVNTVTSVAGRTGNVTLTKNDVNLGNVDNTSDANKPISNATQAALDGKLPTSGQAATVATIAGKLTAGKGVVITGAGTDASPYEIRSTSGHKMHHAHHCNSVLQTYPFNTNSSGGGANGFGTVVTSNAIIDGTFGCLSGTTGPNSTGTGGRYNGASNIILSAAGRKASQRSVIKLEDLPDALGEDFTLFVGFSTNSVPTADFTTAGESYGVWIDSAHTNFQLMKRVGSTVTYVDTGIPVTADTWYAVEVEIVGAANMNTDAVVNVYVDLHSANARTLRATSTGVTAASLGIWAVHLRKLLGTTARLAYLAYIELSGEV